MAYIKNPVSALFKVEEYKPLPWWRMVWKQLLQLPRTGSVQFLVLFSGFVFAGATMEFLLEGGKVGSRFGDFFQAFWFTVVTITTVGYGDMSPTTPLAQAWAMVEMLVGIGLVGIITGNVTSLLVERNRKRALGLVALPHLSGHTIICGWKQGMRPILMGILEANTRMSSIDLVLVNTQNPGDVGELKRTRELRQLQFVFGSPTDPNALQMASVSTADRVIVLAEDSGRTDPDAADSRTVLAATTVETLSRSVYTCTELIQPHFARYLRLAQVEEVVMGDQNARSLLVAGSLGDGMSKVVSQFFPENNRQLRVLRIPASLVGKTYGDLAAHFSVRGLLPFGFLSNAGNLHERKREKLRAAMRVDKYKPAVEALAEVVRMNSNVPILSPPMDTPIGADARALVLVPSLVGQSPEERDFRMANAPRFTAKKGEHLGICGWKHDMAEFITRILDVHRQAGRPLKQITVVSKMALTEVEAIKGEKRLKNVHLVDGEATDPSVLEAAGLGAVDRVLVLDVSGGSRSDQEADARNVMVAMAVNELNPRAYKCVELKNRNFSEHLKMADVEEIIFTQRHQEFLLVQASLGTGLAHTINLLLRYGNPTMKVMEFPKAPPGTSFQEFAGIFAGKGETLAGVIDHAGNLFARKQEVLYEAQVQPHISNAIDHLLRLKTVENNKPFLNPGPDFIPGSHTRAVVIVPSSESVTHG